MPESLTLSRELRAPIETVYGMWVDASAMKRWFIPEGHEARWIAPPAIDPVIGGAITVKIASQGMEYHVEGVFEELKPYSKLAFRWRWDDSFPITRTADDTLVEIEFRNVAEMTQMTLKHSEFESAVARDAHIRGWNRCFDGIQGLLAENQT